MPQLQGEVSLLSLYADVHYYFTQPAPKTSNHRFDKRSYVYLYHDALNRRGRLEIANYAGTADQDAFNGYLDQSEVEYSYKHPTLFTITVTSPRIRPQSSNPSPQADASQWHLASASDPQGNQGRFMYKLHTVDLYFWTTDDATLFLDSLRRVLLPGQLRILDGNTTHPEHRDSMSPVVQQLEKAAIVSPAAAQPQPVIAAPAQVNAAPVARRTASGTNSIVSTVSATSGLSPPPPPPAINGQSSPVQDPTVFAPMAYNPAAPAAPEPIAHREKTPPPIDAETGTGLGQAAVHEHGSAAPTPAPSFGPGAMAGGVTFNPLQAQFAPQPSIAGASPFGPVPTIGVQRTNTVGVGAVPGAPVGFVHHQSSTPASISSFAGPPSAPSPLHAQQPVYQQVPAPGVIRQATLAQPPMGAAPPYSPGIFGAQQPGAGTPAPQGVLYASVPPAPYVAGYHPQAQYGQPGIQSPYGVSHTLHNQLYIPEGASAHGHGHDTPVQAQQPGANATIGDRMKAVDKSVSGTFKGFLKKIDKKI